MKRSLADRQLLARTLMFFDPVPHVRCRVRSVGDIFEIRHELKRLVYRPAVLSHLARLVRRALAEGRRFRVFECVRVLRAQAVAADGRVLPAPVVRDLFAIYQRLILGGREELQWALSRLVKDQRLNEDEIRWMAERWRESDHLVNRLLRYPVPHPAVTAWIRERYANRELRDRTSELLALLIPEDGIAPFSREDPIVLAWAVFKANLPLDKKLGNMESLVTHLPAELIAEMSICLVSPRLIYRALRRRGVPAIEGAARDRTIRAEGRRSRKSRRGGADTS